MMNGLKDGLDAMRNDRFDDDTVRPFVVRGLNVRGSIVRLGPLIDDIMSAHDYPVSVSSLLGEAVALTLLLGIRFKFDGRFMLHIQSDGPVSMLVVDHVMPDKVRAYAKFDASALSGTGAGTGSNTTAFLLGNGHFALTVDQSGRGGRYQGVSPLEGQSLAGIAGRYFHQSEQIPTFVKLASRRGTDNRWRVGGLLIQHLPSPDDAPNDGSVLNMRDTDRLMDGEWRDESWIRARLIAATVEDGELLDPGVADERLLYRLYHGESVHAFQAQKICHVCGCTAMRVARMLDEFTADERRDMISDDGDIVVTCQFCSTEHRFDPADWAGDSTART